MQLQYVLIREKWENDCKTGRLVDYEVLGIFPDQQSGWQEMQEQVVKRAAEEKAEHWVVGRVDSTHHSTIEGRTVLGKESTPVDSFDYVWKLYPVPVN